MPLKQEEGQVIISVDSLERLIATIFEAAGCSADEAMQVSRYMVDGNLTGHDSHGVIRTSRYVSWMGDRVFPGRDITVVSESDNIAVIEGNYGFGQIIAPKAVQIGIDKAKKNGVCVVALRNSGHMGRIGTWAEMTVEQNVVFVGFVNVRASLLVAPFNGVERRMSTAPFIVGVPVAGQDPIILDFATSAVAEGKALVALQGGKALPPDVLITPDGERTSDPVTLYGEQVPGKVANPMDGPGALRALGDHKGSGLSFICEILAGAFTGAGCAGPLPRKYSNNMLAIFMDVDAFQSEDGFAGEIRSYIDFFTSSAPEEKDGKVLIPGDKERAFRKERRANGIPIVDGAWQSILGAAQTVGLSDADVDRAIRGD
ncbi:MAG: Ldh family oxidoreductase [Rhodospirillales bacterium]|nr:Ldh family oxidoreductase [Rhodospirillales bacterium]